MKRFTLGSSSIGELEKQYVNEVLDNNYISPGPVVAEVERLCAEMHGKKYGLALNSGQNAIHVALQALIETRYNGEGKPLVAVPACTYISTLSAAILAGCDIVLIDVEFSGNMSPNALRTTLEQQRNEDDPVDIVIPVHLFGKACDPRIFPICKEFNTWIIEDACESTFAKGIGKGHIITTSFFSNHLISAGGGGMIMTDDEELDLYCWKLINHGRSSRFNNNDIHRISEKFHFDTWAHSLKWNDVSAAIAKAQIERKEELYAARKRNATELWKYLWPWEADYEKIILPDMKDHSFMMYTIILKEPLDANNVIYYLNDHGVEIRRMMPIISQPVVKNYFNNRDLSTDFPIANYIDKQGFYVGVHPELSIEDMEEIGSVIDEAIKQEVNRNES